MSVLSEGAKYIDQAVTTLLLILLQRTGIRTSSRGARGRRLTARLRGIAKLRRLTGERRTARVVHDEASSARLARRLARGARLHGRRLIARP